MFARGNGGGEPPGDGGRIARAGAHLQHAVRGRQIGGRQHQGDNIGLGDGLAGLHRKGCILIGARLHRIRHEGLSRDSLHRRQDPRIGSCPKPWCSFGGVITAISGWAGSGQAATAGRLTRASSLSGAKLSSGM